MNEEQKLRESIDLPLNKIWILNRLTYRSYCSQSDIENWVRDEYKGKFIEY